jgi:glycosyltransferase involved in cell wall biosynthesis
MNLAVIGPTHPFRGGISHYTTLLVQTLRSKTTVCFVSYRRQYFSWLYPGASDRDSSQQILSAEVPNLQIDATSLFQWFRAANFILKEHCQVAILQWSVAYWTPFYLVFLYRLKRSHKNIPVLFICHNVQEHAPAHWKIWLTRLVLRRGRFFIVHSQPDKEELTCLLGKKREGDVFVSPHPIYRHLNQNAPTQSEAREKLNIQAPHVILFFGFIREYKGLQYLLQAMPQILHEMPVKLIVAGEVWGDSSQLSQMIIDLKLEDHVLFIPQYIPDDQAALYFSAADLVVLPYLSATQSGVIQLAYGFNKPVLVTRVGGLPEAVSEGETGYLVPPRNSEALAQATIDFFRNRRAEEMERHIIQEQPKYSWEKMVELIERIASSVHSDDEF